MVNLLSQKATAEEKKSIEEIKAPVSLEAVLAIKTIQL